MKRALPWLVAGMAALWVASAWKPVRPGPDGFDFAAFGKIPVVNGGRVKPLDTLARTSLVIIHGRQSLRLGDGRKLAAVRWLAEMFFNAPVADTYPVFVIHHPDVLGLLGWQQDGRKYFSYKELEPFLEKIDRQGKSAGEVEAPRRSPFQTAIVNLRNELILYQRLQHGIQPPDATAFAVEIGAYAEALAAGAGAPARFSARYQSLASTGSLLAVPPAPHTAVPGREWRSVGQSLLDLSPGAPAHPVTLAYARAGDAFRDGNVETFNGKVRDLAQALAAAQPRDASRAAFEFSFNNGAPFYQSMCLYVLAFLLVCASWLGWTPALNRSAYAVLLIALLVHTFGLGARMYLQGRPPVTNLYSSAIFIGWGTVVIGLILERYFRDGVGAACSAAIGFVTLIIAHHLAENGDTLEMLQAVLDTNIWLATHVVVITLGYAAMFLAGMLAIVYVLRGVFTRSLDPASARSLSDMTFGVVCFATLFSFVGTVLGGIWADQSWGRFWGWDPKENGALMIVLWCALILHARLGGLIRQRGLMVMALFGNIITSFSWFGVNMLGVGLHSYGFMNKAFPWLMAFVASQLALMAIASLPHPYWRSTPLNRPDPSHPA